MINIVVCVIACIEDQKVQVEVLTRQPVVELKTALQWVVKVDHGVIKTEASPLTAVSSPDTRRPPILESLLHHTMTVDDQRNQLDRRHRRDNDLRVLPLTGRPASTRDRRWSPLQLSCPNPTNTTDIVGATILGQRSVVYAVPLISVGRVFESGPYSPGPTVFRERWNLTWAMEFARFCRIFTFSWNLQNLVLAGVKLKGSNSAYFGRIQVVMISTWNTWLAEYWKYWVEFIWNIAYLLGRQTVSVCCGCRWQMLHILLSSGGRTKIITIGGEFAVVGCRIWQTGSAEFGQICRGKLCSLVFTNRQTVH